MRGNLLHCLNMCLFPPHYQTLTCQVPNYSVGIMSLRSRFLVGNPTPTGLQPLHHQCPASLVLLTRPTRPLLLPKIPAHTARSDCWKKKIEKKKGCAASAQKSMAITNRYWREGEDLDDSLYLGIQTCLSAYGFWG
jgi:hypothetical protein